MIRRLKKYFLVGGWILISSAAISQSQTCPVNINFSMGTLTHWGAFNGVYQSPSDNTKEKQLFDASKTPPSGTVGATSIPEYGLPSVNAIQTITNQGVDTYGGFPTIPSINGYNYNYSILLGSTSISHSGGDPNGPGGYIRGVNYVINVPATPVGQPYTMTYAYAMVLENGSHNTNQQPLFSATLTTADSVITCASPAYDLPTLNNSGPTGGHATLDSAAAYNEGFTPSHVPSPNPDPNGSGPNPPHLYDVWTKSWREVTFDLSPYRGQQVVLTFEADNCVPGGHFAYAYVALRNTCSGLIISGDSVACINGSLTYSIPELTGAKYNWTVPNGWSITSGDSTNIITVTVGNNSGVITAKEQNGCANLTATLPVTTSPPTIPGSVASDAQVCAGNNMTILNLTGNRGTILSWIASTDGGQTWRYVPDTTNTYTAQNLSTTTIFEALIQNGQSCALDSSSGATVNVSPLSVGGTINPADTSICQGQNVAIGLNLLNKKGQVVNWQSSPDSLNWQNFNPQFTDTSFDVANLNTTTFYRVIVKSGVCPADTSTAAAVHYINVPFPQGTSEPADTTICYGSNAYLNAVIIKGTNYSWSNTGSLENYGNGTIGLTPQGINAIANPASSTLYVLSIKNGACPNILYDSFMVNVIPPIIVNAGHDTAVVINQPLQLQATVNDPAANIFNWQPPDYLNNPAIYNPIAIFSSQIDSITYTVTATDSAGCFGTAKIKVIVFKTLPDIFVPNAFTPGSSINNRFKPIPVGVTSLAYFRIYNRWGQLVYNTNKIGEGWDGIFNGKAQDTGSYVWMVQGTDYTGKLITKKGTMTLVR